MRLVLSPDTFVAADALARVTLVGLSKNHAMTFNQSVGYDTPVPLISSDSHTTLLDATGWMTSTSAHRNFARCVRRENRSLVA